jgi:diadenylate cyclase
VPIDREGPLRATLALVAPGTALRDGLERILRGRTGALIVLGHDKAVEGLCTGGFPLDVEFSSTRLRELCKMDGAVVLSSDGTRIVRAAVHLMPDSAIPTEESGTRHRTAERVARSLDVPVISVSEDMGLINVYVGPGKHTLEEIPRLLVRGNQALQTLERYKVRLDDSATSLTALEVEDLVTLRDVAGMLQRSETVRRVAEEIDSSIVELGAEAHLIRLQMDELLEDVDDDRELVLLDYLPDDHDERLETALAELAALSTDELLDLRAVAATLRRPGSLGKVDLDENLQPRGYRLLAKVPRLPEDVSDRLVERFGPLQKLMRIPVQELASVDGVEPAMAQAAKDGLARLAEATLLDRFH